MIFILVSIETFEVAIVFGSGAAHSLPRHPRGRAIRHSDCAWKKLGDGLPGFFVAASARKVCGADHDALFHISDRERKKPRHVGFASELTWVRQRGASAKWQKRTSRPIDCYRRYRRPIASKMKPSERKSRPPVGGRTMHSRRLSTQAPVHARTMLGSKAKRRRFKVVSRSIAQVRRQ